MKNTVTLTILFLLLLLTACQRGAYEYAKGTGGRDSSSQDETKIQYNYKLDKNKPNSEFKK